MDYIESIKWLYDAEFHQWMLRVEVNEIVYGVDLLIAATFTVGRFIDRFGRQRYEKFLQENWGTT